MRQHYDPHLIGSLREELTSSPRNLSLARNGEHCSNYFRAVKGRPGRQQRVMPPMEWVAGV